MCHVYVCIVLFAYIRVCLIMHVCECVNEYYMFYVFSIDVLFNTFCFEIDNVCIICIITCVFVFIFLNIKVACNRV